MKFAWVTYFSEVLVIYSYHIIWLPHIMVNYPRIILDDSENSIIHKKTIILPVVLYSCETWYLTLS